jgi:hypothetical protein
MLGKKKVNHYHYPDPSTINLGGVKKATTPNPAESLLQYLALAY